MVVTAGAAGAVAAAPFGATSGLRAFAIAPTAVIGGVLRSVGIPLVAVPGATGGMRSDLNAKAVAAAEGAVLPGGIPRADVVSDVAGARGVGSALLLRSPTRSPAAAAAAATAAAATAAPGTLPRNGRTSGSGGSSGDATAPPPASARSARRTQTVQPHAATS